MLALLPAAGATWAVSTPQTGSRGTVPLWARDGAVRIPVWRVENETLLWKVRRRCFALNSASKNTRTQDNKMFLKNNNNKQHKRLCSESTLGLAVSSLSDWKVSRQSSGSDKDREQANDGVTN